MEEAVSFLCGSKRLYGILHMPKERVSRSGIILVVGGPQTRIGSHRLYVHLARFLCSRGIPALRFDYEGLGDSEGDFVGFRGAGPSIEAAIQFMNQRFSRELPLILWSLCDGATASAIWSGESDGAIAGLILCNPFLLSLGAALEEITLHHYYLPRILDRGFLKKLFLFQVNPIKSLRSICRSLRSGVKGQADYPVEELFREGLRKYRGPIRFILSTEDILARHFVKQIGKDREVTEMVRNRKIGQSFIEGADHTFTKFDAKDKLFATVMEFVWEIERLWKNRGTGIGYRGRRC